jgi:CubicO group peptidase (beta-lactamase class C family)
MQGRYRDQITVKHLITFAVEYGDIPKLSSLNDREKMLNIFINSDLPFPPGISYRYTNISSMLLTLFLEKKFGITFDFLVNELCLELGMVNTNFSPLKKVCIDEIVPTELSINRGVLQDESARLYGAPTGSAGLFSTITDLLVFGQSFFGPNTYLDKDIIKRMSISQFGNSVAMTFGLGMGLRHQNECDIVDREGKLVTVLKKNGYSGVHFCVFPENNFCFAVFGNICYPERPTAEVRDIYTRFHKKLLSMLYEYQDVL